MSVTTYYLKNGAVIELPEDSEFIPVSAEMVYRTLPCNWCTEPVPVNEFGLPFNGHYRQYERCLVVYCCYECSLREYDFLFENHPDSPECYKPVPDSLRRDYLVNN